MNHPAEISDEAYFSECGKFANDLAERISRGTRTPPVSTAVEPILRRVMASATSIVILRMRKDYEAGFDIAVILRAMYDAMLQGLYILNDPSCRETRAMLFLDYAKVEQFKGIGRFDRSPTWLGKKLAASSLRPEREPLITQAFDAVKDKYLDKKGRILKYWYGNNLAHLAGEVGLELEYDLLQSHLSSLVHSTPFALAHPARVDDAAVTWSWVFARRLALKYAEWCQVPLTADDREIMTNDSENIFDSPAQEATSI